MFHAHLSYLTFTIASLSLASCATEPTQTPVRDATQAPTHDATSAPTQDATKTNSGVKPGSSTEEKLRAAMNSPDRKPEQKARDRYRHPMETLTFFGLRDDMTVVELWPGGGWYTVLLAPVLAKRGKLYVTSSDPNGPSSDEATQEAQFLAKKMQTTPELLGKVKVSRIKPPDNLTLAPDGTVDMILTFRNFHGWIAGKFDTKVIAAAYRALKPGGIFGITEHRAKPGADPQKAGDTGYVPEDYIIKTVQAAGFKLAGKSEVNDNPKDTKDYPKGVWTLPPTYELGQVDRAKYEAIGESDRMTLKFVK